jgi:hypothetical protein
VATQVWTGTTDGDLSKAANWGGTLPSGADNAEIPTGLATYPSSGVYPPATGFITIDPGGTIAGGTFPATAGVLTNNGVISGGTFNNEVRLSQNTPAVVSGGTFNGKVAIGSSTVFTSGATFNGPLFIAESLGNCNVNGPIYEHGGKLLSAAPPAVTPSAEMQVYQYGAFVIPGSGLPRQIAVIDASGNPINLTGRTLELRATPPATPGQVLWTWTTNDALSITGASNNVIQIAADSTHTQIAGDVQFTVWDKTAGTASAALITQLVCSILPAPAP